MIILHEYLQTLNRKSLLNASVFSLVMSLKDQTCYDSHLIHVLKSIPTFSQATLSSSLGWFPEADLLMCFIPE